MTSVLKQLLSCAVVVAVVAPVAARAQARGGERLLVYVDDVSASDPKLKQEAAALTSALCGALAKDRRLDVMCAPDVKQILGFAAASSMIGTTSPAVENVQKRLNTVKFVVGGSLAPRGGDVVLTVQAGPKAKEADASALFADSAIVKVEEVAPAKQMRLLEKLPDVTARVAKALLSPTATTPPPPPAPLQQP
jgi:hypothetical protein